MPPRKSFPDEPREYTQPPREARNPHAPDPWESMQWWTEERYIDPKTRCGQLAQEVVDRLRKKFG